MYSAEELMAVVMAREIRDGECVGVGVQSAVASAAALLARHTSAPEARFAIRGFPGVHPLIGSREFTMLAQRGKVDLFFLSFAQVDQHANINLQYLGDFRHPAKRFYGAFAAPVYYYAVWRTILFRTEHSPRVFVPEVDYVTASARRQAGLDRRGGPVKVVTPLAVLGYDPARQRLRLESYHPGQSIESVRDATGFRLRLSPTVGETPAPRPDELGALRGPVYSWMESRFPAFVREGRRTSGPGNVRMAGPSEGVE